MASVSAKAGVPTDDQLHAAVSSLKMISDSTRLKALFLLEQQESSVVELCEALGVTLPVVSHHVALLKVSGIVKTRREGRHIYYSLTQLGRFAVQTARRLMKD